MESSGCKDCSLSLTATDCQRFFGFPADFIAAVTLKSVNHFATSVKSPLASTVLVAVDAGLLVFE